MKKYLLIGLIFIGCKVSKPYYTIDNTAVKIYVSQLHGFNDGYFMACHDFKLNPWLKYDSAYEKYIGSLKPNLIKKVK